MMVVYIYTFQKIMVGLTNYTRCAKEDCKTTVWRTKRGRSCLLIDFDELVKEKRGRGNRDVEDVGALIIKSK